MFARSCSTDIAALVTVLALALGCATSKEQQSTALPSYQESQTHTATAVVLAVDLQTRQVTLKGEDGNAFSFVAGEQVRNLAQVQVGDTVKVTYTESLAVEVKRADGSVPELGTAVGIDRAPPGQKPSGTVGRVVTVSAVIVAIDRTTSRVTLKGPEGNFRVLQVRDPKKLENVAVGDMVYATYTESLGIAVEKIPPAAAK